MEGRAVSPLVKYFLLQVPGWILAAILLMWLWPLTGWDPWIAGGAYAVFVLKDFALYPWLRAGYESNVPTGSETLIGAIGVTRQRLDPKGYVKIGGELWRARAGEGSAPIEAGTEVRVVGAEGLTLTVIPRRGAS